MQKITPFLWFNDQAEEAAKFYASIFEDSEVLHVTRYGEGGPQPAGTVMTVTFQLQGQTFIGLNGGPHFQFTEAISFVVNCETQEEIDRYWDQLTDGGKPVQCGWLKDRYGLSWQIVPTRLGDWMTTPDKAASGRVMGALMQMVKLDMAQLQAAFEGR